MQCLFFCCCPLPKPMLLFCACLFLTTALHTTENMMTLSPDDRRWTYWALHFLVRESQAGTLILWSASSIYLFLYSFDYRRCLLIWRRNQNMHLKWPLVLWTLRWKTDYQWMDFDARCVWVNAKLIPAQFRACTAPLYYITGRARVEIFSTFFSFLLRIVRLLVEQKHLSPLMCGAEPGCGNHDAQNYSQTNGDNYSLTVVKTGWYKLLDSDYVELRRWRGADDAMRGFLAIRRMPKNYKPQRRRHQVIGRVNGGWCPIQ